MDSAVEIGAPPPICACCREPIGLVWRATVPTGHIICGGGGCEQWVWAQGLSYYGERKPPPDNPAHRRRPRTCATCKGALPKGRDQFRSAGKLYCTLTCMNRA